MKKDGKRYGALLGLLLLAGSAWGNCTEAERTEMLRLGLDPQVIAYTCEESSDIVMEEPPPPPQPVVEEPPPSGMFTKDLGYRQQVSVGVGTAAGSYQNRGPKTSLNGTSLVIQYHWVESAGYTLGLQWLLTEMAGGASATDEVRYDQQSFAMTVGWLLIDRPTLMLAPELVLGFWGSGHLTDAVENARAQPSLNGLEIPVSIQITDGLHVGAEYGWYNLSMLSLPESGIDIKYPDATGEARLEQSFRFYGTYRF